MGVKATLPERAGMAEFSEYFQNTWIRGCYSAASWNVYDLGDCRTNNHIEGWHSKLKKVVGKAHPNVFELVRIFKIEQAATSVKLAQLAAGARPPSQARWTIEKNKNIEELKTQFSNNTISLEQYLRGLSSLTNLRV